MARTPEVFAETPCAASCLMDALTDLLRVVRFEGSLFLEARFREPWCVRSQVLPEHCGADFKKGGGLIAFHYVLEGRLQVQLGKERPRSAGPGDIIVLAHNNAHLVGSDVTLSPVDAATLIRKVGENELARIDFGTGRQVKHHFVCGFLATAVREHPGAARSAPGSFARRAARASNASMDDRGVG
jgi:hypothetical protein